MDKEFLPYELALKLKALGFKQRVFTYYEDSKPKLHTAIEGWDFNTSFLTCVSRPTYSQVFKWFRDKHDLWFDKTVNFNFEDNLIRGYHYNIYQAKDFKVDLNKSVKFLYFGISEEKAELACLEKLIEIVEQNEFSKKSN